MGVVHQTTIPAGHWASMGILSVPILVMVFQFWRNRR